jgi:hypothetical protein
MEVADRQWQQFCQQVQRLAGGVMASIQVQHPDGTTQAICWNVPLQRIAFDQTSDPCSDQLVLEVGLPGQKPVRHVVLEPIHLRLKNGKTGDRYHHLHILAENGTTLVTFHPGLSPALVRGLEPLAVA